MDFKKYFKNIVLEQIKNKRCFYKIRNGLHKIQCNMPTYEGIYCYRCYQTYLLNQSYDSIQW